MKLKFHKDTFYDGKIFACAGEIKEVSEENGLAYRWIRRGATRVEESAAKIAPAKIAAPAAVEIVVAPEVKVDAASNEFSDFLEEDKPIAQESVKGTNTKKNKISK